MERVRLKEPQKAHVFGGRPPGARNKMTVIKESLMAARNSGELPHEFLLRVCRGEKIKHGEDEHGNPRWYFPDFEMRVDAAKAAAPYYAPKLSTVEVVKGMSDDILDETIAGLIAETGVTFTIDGESTTPPIDVAETTGHVELVPNSTVNRRRLVTGNDTGPPTVRFMDPEPL